MALSNEIVYLRDFAEEAAKRRTDYGTTRRFTTGVSSLDRYLGGGYGRNNGYEIVLLFGPTKIGKSTVGLNFVAGAIKAGHKVGLMVLEDDGADTYMRLTDVLGIDATRRFVTESNGVRCMPVGDMLKSWNLDELLAKMEQWFTEDEREIILLDHLQFAFENAESVRGENEYVKQRVFMQKLNHLMKRVNKTIILISHVAKSSAKGGSQGADKIFGSSAISQAATKIIEVRKDNLGVLQLHLHGSRFTPTPDGPFPFALTGPSRVKLEGAVDERWF